jgi:uncharacterized membrane protein YphA (DoxX/SURF4 family)
MLLNFGFYYNRSMNFEFYNHTVVFALARVVLGILFFMQGYDKVFRIKLRGIIDAYELPVPRPFISHFGVWAGTIYTSYCELVCGPMLIMGLFTNYALYFLALDIIIATIGLGIQNPQLDTRLVFPRIVLLGFLLTCPPVWNVFSVDYLM